MCKRAEQPAGVDLRELMVVADEHDLRASSGGVIEDGDELARADHAGLVNHKDATGGEPASDSVGTFKVRQQRMNGRGGDASAGFELGGCSRGQDRADDTATRALPSLPGCLQCIRLACTGLANDHLDA